MNAFRRFIEILNRGQALFDLVERKTPRLPVLDLNDPLDVAARIESMPAGGPNRHDETLALEKAETGAGDGRRMAFELFDHFADWNKNAGLARRHIAFCL